MKLSDYIRNLTAYGRCCFTLDEAATELGKSKQNISLAIEHLKAAKEIASPAKGFYVIVTPEYQIYECLPAEYFIPYLMDYWQCDYYGGLLTAAMYHGASHQAPQVFQVITDRNRPDICCGKVKVEFIAKRMVEKVPLQEISTAKSVLKISTPEATAMDLLCYPHRSGGLNHIATVLSELCEHMQVANLSMLLEAQPELAWKQRLGYLLELLGTQELANVIKSHLAQQKRVDYILLMPGLTNTHIQHRVKAWKIIENTTVESDL